MSVSTLDPGTTAQRLDDKNSPEVYGRLLLRRVRLIMHSCGCPIRRRPRHATFVCLHSALVHCATCEYRVATSIAASRFNHIARQTFARGHSAEDLQLPKGWSPGAVPPRHGVSGKHRPGSGSSTCSNLILDNSPCGGLRSGPRIGRIRVLGLPAPFVFWVVSPCTMQLLGLLGGHGVDPS